METGMPRTLLVAIGGVAGCVARYWVADLVQRHLGHGFPSGTLVVNVLGSLAFGVIVTLSLERGAPGADLRLLLTTGFCGGFTTMSTFSYETLALAYAGEGMRAAGNVVATLAACLGATWLGVALARMV